MTSIWRSPMDRRRGRSRGSRSVRRTTAGSPVRNTRRRWKVLDLTAGSRPRQTGRTSQEDSLIVGGREVLVRDVSSDGRGRWRVLPAPMTVAGFPTSPRRMLCLTRRPCRRCRPSTDGRRSSLGYHGRISPSLPNLDDTDIGGPPIQLESAANLSPASKPKHSPREHQAGQH